jgi:hypothetical protein
LRRDRRCNSSFLCAPAGKGRGANSSDGHLALFRNCPGAVKRHNPPPGLQPLKPISPASLAWELRLLQHSLQLARRPPHLPRRARRGAAADQRVPKHCQGVPAAGLQQCQQFDCEQAGGNAQKSTCFTMQAAA